MGSLRKARYSQPLIGFVAIGDRTQRGFDQSYWRMSRPISPPENENLVGKENVLKSTEHS